MSVLGAFERVTQLLREGGTSDLEVHVVLLSGVLRCFSCSAEMVARGNSDTICMSPLHLAVICSPSGRFRRGVFGVLDDSHL